MKKRNRRVTKHMSVMAQNAMRFGSLIIVFFVMVIFNWLSSSSCSQLMKRTGDLKSQIKKLDNEITQESARWAQMTTPDRIERALAKNGLSMALARPDQNVRMRGDGTPLPGQLSVKVANQRNAAQRTAKYQAQRWR